MKQQIDPDEIHIGRRKTLKVLAALGIGTATLPHISGISQATEKTWNQVTEYKTITDHTITMSSTLELLDTHMGDDHWIHEFHLAGHGVSVDSSGNKDPDITRHKMSLDESDEDLETYPGVDSDSLGMWPEADKGSGEDWTEGVSTALDIAADTLDSTVGATVLTAVELAEVLLNTLSEDQTGQMPKEVIADYNGVDEISHHWDFHINEDYSSNDWTDYLYVKSQGARAINKWSVGFTDGEVMASEASVVPSSFSSSTQSNRWGDPREMTEKAKETYAVKKIPGRSVKGIDPHERSSYSVKAEDGSKVTISSKAIESAQNRGYTYIAKNPPVNVNPMS